MTPHSSLLTTHKNSVRKAVFLDRDGTINVEKEYLYRREDFEFLPGVPQALRSLQDAGYLLIVVTNQSGVARGYYSLKDVDQLHHYMCDRLRQQGVELAAIYVCPHHPEKGLPPYNIDCECRKAKPGLLLQAAKDFDLDLSASFMIGDKVSDVGAGLSAGCTSYLVRSGHALDEKIAVPIFADLAAAARAILA